MEPERENQEQDQAQKGDVTQSEFKPPKPTRHLKPWQRSVLRITGLLLIAAASFGIAWWIATFFIE